MKISQMKISAALDDPRIFAPAFRDKETWTAWRAFLLALFGLPMDEEQLSLFRACTGRATPPTQQAREAWLVIGRRGGKSFTLALIAIYLAAFKDWAQHLAPGERAVVMVIAADRRQARVIMRYCRGILAASPNLTALVEAERQESIDLTNRVTLEIHTSSFRTVRGYSICAALLDEVAFWKTDEASTEPDFEVINALRPAMSTMPGAMLLAASSPYARRGSLYDAYRKHHGQDNDSILVWQAPTRTMNPSVPQSFIDEAMEEDPASASAEYLAQFRTDIEGFVTREIVQSCTDSGVHERPPLKGVRYVGFIDPSGGSSDSFTCGVAHKEKDGTIVLDALREIRPPFSPESAVDELSDLLKSYGIRKITGDRYAGEWVKEPFRKCGVTYEPSARPKSDLYRDLLPLMNSRKVALLDVPRLAAQLVGLERRTARSGRDSIDHAPGGHDDVANAAAGVLVATVSTGTGYTLNTIFHDDKNPPPETPEERLKDDLRVSNNLRLMEHIRKYG